MRDDDLDELLREAASSYNTPPEPPREAIWQAIAQARDAASVVPIGSRRRLPQFVAAAVGVAAVLVAGIVIGRASRGPATAPALIASAVPTKPEPTEAAVGASHIDAHPLPSEAASGDDVTGTAAGSETGRSAARRLVTAPAQRGALRPRAVGSNDLSNDGGAYRLAVVEHLTRAEVLLTSFRAHAQSGDAAHVDAQFAALSRELLGTTRLLLATRRGDDPNITRLLQDLEYVLMQLSQYANDGRRVDLDALNQSLDKRNVIPKLRSNIPAGLSATSGT